MIDLDEQDRIASDLWMDARYVENAILAARDDMLHITAYCRGLRDQLRLAESKLIPGSPTERAPTQWAYDQACAALQMHRQRADRIEAAALAVVHAPGEWALLTENKDEIPSEEILQLTALRAALGLHSGHQKDQT